MTFRRDRKWGHAMSGLSPAVIMAATLVVRLGIQPFGVAELARPLDSFPHEVATFERTQELEVPTEERTLLDADALLHREYRHASGRSLSMYVAYYGQQTGGSGIHSPTNCLPGSGWETIEHDRVTARTVYGPAEINRYLIEHGSGSRALVYYWYQGRGRVMASEYGVKLDLLKDAILERRTDEGLVRLVFPLGSRDEALGPIDAIAATVVPTVIAELSRHIPG